MTRREIIVADWKASRGILYTNAVMTMLAMLAVAWLKPNVINAKWVLAISTAVSGPLMALRCIGLSHEREHLKALLGPATPDQLLATKFVSALSMAAFSVNIPGLMLLDPRFLLNLNAAVLLLTTISMADMTVSFDGGDFFEGGGFFALAVAAVLMGTVTYWSPMLLEYGKLCYHWVVAHSILSSIAALCAIPVIIVFSVALHEPLG